MKPIATESTASASPAALRIRPAAAIDTQTPASNPVGMWYVARARHGIGDTIWLGLLLPDDATHAANVLRNDAAMAASAHETLHWLQRPHRQVDGIGALAQLLATRGYSGGSMPLCRDTRAPTLRALLKRWWQTRRQQAGTPARAAVRWRFLDASRAELPHNTAPACLFLNAADSAQMRAAASAAGVSTTTWLLWSLDRAVRATLSEADAVLPWVFPVNLRGAVAAASPWVNQCSGITVWLARETTPGALAAQVRDRLGAQEHWQQWLLLNLGRWVGQAGINLIYRFARAEPGRYAGSYSNLGNWPLPGMHLRDSDTSPAVSGAACTAPGSPAYPVSAGTIDWNGRVSLACRVHPVACADANTATDLLAAWRRSACAD